MLSGLRAAPENLRKFGRASVGHIQAQLYTRGALSTEQMVFPDFLGIGAQKAGTTWLYENLRCHPEVFLPDEKELHYFDWNFHRSLRRYARRFEPGSGLVKGEITPCYSKLPLSRIRYIHRLMPDAKLIFLMRNPVERAWSQAIMNLLVRKNRAYEEVNESEFLAHFRHERSISRGDYIAILKSWTSVFPEEQLLVGFFEDILERPKELLTAVFKHIGVSLDVDWSVFPYNRVIHKGIGSPLPDRYRTVLEDMYRVDIERLVEWFGAPAARWRFDSSFGSASSTTNEAPVSVRVATRSAYRLPSNARR